MASSVTTSKLFSELAVEMYDQDTDMTGTGAVVSGAWTDLSQFGCFATVVMTSALTGAGITQVEIVAADDTSATNQTVIKDSGVVAADAVGDYVALECTAAEIAQLSEASGYDLRYVNVQVTCANAADEAVVTMIRGEPRYPQSDLTETTISA